MSLGWPLGKRLRATEAPLQGWVKEYFPRKRERDVGCAGQEEGTLTRVPQKLPTWYCVVHPFSVAIPASLSMRCLNLGERRKGAK